MVSGMISNQQSLSLSPFTLYQKSPEEILMKKSKNLRKAVYQIDEKMKEKFSLKTTTNELEDELTYCRQVIESMEAEEKIREYPNDLSR